MEWLTFVESKLADHQDKIDSRIQALCDQVAINREHSDSRHDSADDQLNEIVKRLESFMQSWSSWEAKQHTGGCVDVDRINTAFLKDDLGRIDYDGHRLAHKDQIESSATIRKTLRHLLLVVAGAAAISVSAWLWMSIKTVAIAEITAEQAQQRPSR
jgi:hypothetical protein